MLEFIEKLKNIFLSKYPTMQKRIRLGQMFICFLLLEREPKDDFFLIYTNLLGDTNLKF